MVAICGNNIAAVLAMHLEIFRIVFICGQCFHTLRFPNDSTLIMYFSISESVQQNDVGVNNFCSGH